MSSVRQEPDHQSDFLFPSIALEQKKEGNEMTLVEEKDYYKQRFYSLRIVLKEVQTQLSQFKNRCAGVDTVTLLLKESKQEVVRLNKHCKVLETAVANLQNRLSTNGLSSSIGIEQTELFVPSASKQTLDNLARENARLRSLLKGSEGAGGKKSSEEVQNLKSEVEKLESENSKLQIQIEEMKVTVRDQVEVINMFQLQDTGSQFPNSNNASKASDMKALSEGGVVSRGCQTIEVAPSKLDKLKESLKLVKEQCTELSNDLDRAQVVTEEDFDKNVITGNGRRASTSGQINKEELLEWKKKYEQVVVMNQRWQHHNENQERQIHGLLSKIAELEDPDTINAMVSNAAAASKKEAAAVKAELDKVTTTNNELRHRLDAVNKEMSMRRPQPQFDMSIVEILKQQIQACTEDFNSERRDREKAVQRAEQLQAELGVVKAQVDKLRAETATMKQLQSTVKVPQFQAEPMLRPSSPSMATPVSQSTRPRSPTPTMASPVSQGIRARGPTHGGIPYHLITPPHQVGGAPWLPHSPASVDSDYLSGFSNNPPSVPVQDHSPIPVAGSEFLSLQRYAMEADGVGPGQGPNANASMPALSARRNQKKMSADLACPKCNREFLDSQGDELLKHMEVCTD